MNPFARFTKKLFGASNPAPQKPLSQQEYIEQESIVGGNLFGDMPSGMSRQFFYMSHHDWFYISVVKGSTERSVIRYHVQPEGVVKSIDGKNHVYITGPEYETFLEATRRYVQAVERDIYKYSPTQYRLTA